MCSEAIRPLTLVQCYPIGVINMIDNGSNDEKIIAVPLSDPSYHGVKSIPDLPAHIFSQMEHFFTVYKQLEGKATAVDTVRGRDVAIETIANAIERYNKYFK